MERYEVVRVLGAGSGGRVVLAKELETGKQVAVKEITLDPKKKTKTKEVVEKEAKILASLKHPHIVCMQESFLDEHEEQLFIVQWSCKSVTPKKSYHGVVEWCILLSLMKGSLQEQRINDYCDGGTLQDRTTAAKSNNSLIEESQIMQWFVQVTMAVHHIHSNKILHRDLKTENVFLTKKGVAKIGDFGIARKMESTVDMAQTCCGTPCYLSPELCQDMPYSSKADVWSLGCLLHELCALKYAFDANNIISLFYKIVKGEPENIPEQFSQSIRELIQQMLSKKPDDRPSAGAILNLSYVQDHLASFIKEKENLQEALHARKHLKLTGNKTTNDDVKRCSSALGSKLLPELVNKSLKQRAKSTTPTKLVSMTTNDDKKQDSNEAINVDKEQTKDRDEASDYSDDFDESEEEVYLDDFEDDSPMGGSLKKPLAVAASPVDTNDADLEYLDDFEEDSDEEEVLDDILASARAAREVEEEDLVEDNDQSVSCRQRLKEHVIDALGEKVFEEVCGQLETSSVEKTLAERPEFEKVQSESNLMETCFLVNELFIDNTRTVKDS